MGEGKIALIGPRTCMIEALFAYCARFEVLIGLHIHPIFWPIFIIHLTMLVVTMHLDLMLLTDQILFAIFVLFSCLVSVGVWCSTLWQNAAKQPGLTNAQKGLQGNIEQAFTAVKAAESQLVNSMPEIPRGSDPVSLMLRMFGWMCEGVCVCVLCFGDYTFTYIFCASPHIK